MVYGRVILNEGKTHFENSLLTTAQNFETESGHQKKAFVHLNTMHKVFGISYLFLIPYCQQRTLTVRFARFNTYKQQSEKRL